MEHIIKQLNKEIPTEIKSQIAKQYANSFSRECVYRVAKNGIINEEAFISTYEEFKKDIHNGKKADKYPLDDKKTYGTSISIKVKFCEKYLSCLKGGLKAKYPHPIIIKGKTYKEWGVMDNPSENGHINWWIFTDKIQEIINNFMEYKGGKNDG